MEDVPLARLMVLALRLLVDEMHVRLAAAGYGDLRPAHGYVLNAAAREGGVTASAVAGILGMTKQGAAKVIAELERTGYVVRGDDHRDARARPVALTRRGRSALAAATRAQQQLETEWEALAGPGDMAGLRRVLEGALAATGAEPAAMPLRPVW